MSAAPVATNASITDRRIAAAQAAEQAKQTWDAAKARVKAQDQETDRMVGLLASLEADREQNMLAAALDRPLPTPAPNVAEMETLRADIEISKRVSVELERQATTAEQAHSEAERECKAQISNDLQDTAVGPARDAFADALDAVREAAVKLMAAHKLAYHDYSERKPPYHSANDVSGPAAQWLATLQTMQWPDYPYSIRPAWLPVNGRFWPDELPGVAKQTALLKASVDQGPKS
jgi:hypothetical protein